jgi:plasmid stability protein
MSSQTVTLTIPDSLYAQLKERAEQAERSVEDETLEVLASVVPSGGRLPDDLADAVESLGSLDDAALWNAARSRLAAEVSGELEALHTKQQRDSLSADEGRRLSELKLQYERHLLIRAQALALLKQRGHDVSSLIAS